MGDLQTEIMLLNQALIKLQIERDKLLNIVSTQAGTIKQMASYIERLGNKKNE